MILDLFRKEIDFENLQGYDDIKDIVRRELDAEDNYNLLFVGPPASAKTLFLLGILDMRKNGVYFDGSNTTNRFLDVLEEERPRIICIDELDKLPRIFQNQLLNFMESGRVKVDQQHDFEIKVAPATRLTGYPSLYSQDSESSFYRDTEQQFLDVSEKVTSVVIDCIAFFTDMSSVTSSCTVFNGNFSLSASDFIFSPLWRLRIVAYVRKPFLANVKEVSWPIPLECL